MLDNHMRTQQAVSPAGCKNWLVMTSWKGSLLGACSSLSEITACQLLRGLLHVQCALHSQDGAQQMPVRRPFMRAGDELPRPRLAKQLWASFVQCRNILPKLTKQRLRLCGPQDIMESIMLSNRALSWGLAQACWLTFALRARQLRPLPPCPRHFQNFENSCCYNQL